MEIAGLPLHPLVIHAVVVLTPLAVLAGTVFALLPKWRWLTRWVALVLTVISFGSIVVARQSGRSLLEDRAFLVQGGSPVADLLHTHQERAGVLLWVAFSYLVVLGLAFWLLPAPSGLASGKLGHTGSPEPWVSVVVPASVVVLGIVVLVWLVLTADAGARAVWR